MPSYSATLYIEPSTIEQITVGTNYGDISISRSSVSGNYGVFTTTSIGWDGESSKQITISADGYNNYTGTLLFGGKARKWEDFYATMTEAVPKYVSNLSDGTNTYIIKDANAVKSVNNVQPINGNVTLSIPTQASDIGAQPTLVSGTNIKTINNTSLLGSGNIDIGGSGSSYSPNLFDYKWSDYEIADQSWIKADSFSWQDGTVYSDAYNHLVADISGITASTETVGSYTITYYQATDGHKVVLADQETIVSNIYTESGVAWYYILDTTNQRFKLPRSSHGNIVEKYQDGTEWYRVYSDGWCEQGGAMGTSTTVTLLKEMADTSYYVDVTWDGGKSSNFWPNDAQIRNKTVNSFYTTLTRDSGNVQGTCWIVEGYCNQVPANSQYKYLYFYVGQFSQSATEQTAGITTAQLNAKVDLDLDNMTPSATAKETIVGWGIPDYTAGVAISTGYVAVSNGMVKIVRGGGSWGVSLRVDGVVVDGNYSNTTNEGGCLIAFVKKGSTVTWDTGNISDTPTFFPCVGG